MWSLAWSLLLFVRGCEDETGSMLLSGHKWPDPSTPETSKCLGMWSIWLPKVSRWSVKCFGQTIKEEKSLRLTFSEPHFLTFPKNTHRQLLVWLHIAAKLGDLLAGSDCTSTFSHVVSREKLRTLNATVLHFLKKLSCWVISHLEWTPVKFCCHSQQIVMTRVWPPQHRWTCVWLMQNLSEEAVLSEIQFWILWKNPVTCWGSNVQSMRIQMNK